MRNKRRRICRTSDTKVCPAYRRLKDDMIISDYNAGITLDRIAEIHGFAGRGSILYIVRKFALPSRRKRNDSNSIRAAE